MKERTMEERQSWENFQHDFAMDILKAMPENKKETLKHALDRNCILTTTYGLYSSQTITVYKEGWYIELDGCRCNFKVWAGDNDGEFVFTRKPNEKNLHPLYSHSFYGLYKLSAEDVIC